MTLVSRETRERLETYLGVLTKWQPRINLVGTTTLRDPWRRHILDSTQLIALIPESATTLIDLGSGAGFPGMVLAICGVSNVHLIESDQRKVAFLREVAAATNTNVTIHCARIEAVSLPPADVVTARALAPLAQLIDYALPLLGPRGVCLFLKGERAEREIPESLTRWSMNLERFPSQSAATGRILRLSSILPRLV